MFKQLLGSFWRNLPARFRRFTVRIINAHFTVTVGGIIFDKEGKVLLLKHVFRPGSGWGLPGGFLQAGEQPEDALRRELREEIQLEVDRLKIFTSRSFKKPQQVEIVFLCQTTDGAKAQSVEVERAVWFSPASLPAGLPRDQKQLIERAAAGWSKTRD